MASSRDSKTQTALAKKSGVAQSTIGRIPRGQVNPQSENLERLARSFGLSYSTLAAIAEGDESVTGAVENLEPARVPRRVPLLSLTQAGRFADYAYRDVPCDAAHWTDCPEKAARSADPALKVSGTKTATSSTLMTSRLMLEWFGVVVGQVR
jgi:transcriptional regulator with XRE-family HTH domain